MLDANPYKTPVKIFWKKLHPAAQIPKVASSGAACFDLCYAGDSDFILEVGQILTIPTGLACEIPQGFELQVRARSGLSLKAGLFLVNGIGTIDSDYRGEIKVIACILGKNPLVIKPGDRIAQALVSAVPQVVHFESAELSTTERGSGGFGSTGISK